MSLKITRRTALATLASLVCTQRALADTSVISKMVCPICQEKYEARLTASSFISGQRLDTRPIGSVVSPPRIAVCPKCGFVDFREGQEHPKNELAVLSKYVQSDDYKKLIKTETPYFRVARMFEQLKRQRSQIAYAYLLAAWEVEYDKDQSRWKQYVSASLAEYERVISDTAETADQRQTAQMLKVELLRRLGKFEDAARHLKAINKLEAFQKEPYPMLIKRQLELIEKKDAKPHAVREKEKD